MESQIEFWLPIQGFEGYDVSNFGRVRTWRKLVRGYHGYINYVINKSEFTIVPAYPQSKQYMQISLYSASKGRGVSFLVHRLVAMAFLPNLDELPEVNHLTGLRSDPRLDGLEWADRPRNMRHAFDNGLFKTRVGAANRSAKLSEQDVRDIYTRVKAGENGAAIAREYGITRTTPSQIARGKTWTHLNLGEN